MSAAYDDAGAVGSEMSAIDDGGSMVCPVHGVHTRISCVSCGRPICPDCAVPSPVGLTCGEHGQRSIRLVRWAPARGPVRSGFSPWFLLLPLGFVLAGVLRYTATFFVALVPGSPWIGMLVIFAIIGAITLSVVYWVRR